MAGHREKVAGIVRAGDVPLQIPAQVIAELREREQAGCFEERRRSRVKTGDKVRFVSGPFEGQAGTCASVTRDHAAVLIAMLQRYVRVNVPASILVPA